MIEDSGFYVRALDEDNVLVRGYCCFVNGIAYVVPLDFEHKDSMNAVRVRADTICRFSGAHDSEHTPIYENDVIVSELNGTWIVKYSDRQLRWEVNDIQEKTAAFSLAVFLDTVGKNICTKNDVLGTRRRGKLNWKKI